jgi:hypothetical protein
MPIRDESDIFVLLEDLYQNQAIKQKEDCKIGEAEKIDWKSAALCFGEELVDVGPDGYYNFTPAQWIEWVKKEYQPTPQTQKVNSLKED